MGRRHASLSRPVMSKRFDPRQLRGLFMHYDAFVPSGQHTAAVNTWRDRGLGGPGDASKGSDNAPTIDRLEYQGLPCVKFAAASSQALTTGTPTISSYAMPTTYFLVTRVDTQQTGGGFWFDGTTRQAALQRGDGSGDYSIFAGSIIDTGVTGTMSRPSAWTMCFDGTSSFFRKDSVQIGSGDTGTNALGYPIFIGKTASGFYLNSPIWELFAYSRRVDGAEMLAIEGALRAKYGTF